VSTIEQALGLLLARQESLEREKEELQSKLEIFRQKLDQADIEAAEQVTYSHFRDYFYQSQIEFSFFFKLHTYR
jgi:hypothetical protein